MEVVKGKFPDKIDKMDTENLPWYKLKISDFEGACYRGLKKSERLLLRELFDLYWKEGGLPNDPKELSKLLYHEYTPLKIRAFLQGKASKHWITVEGKELYCSKLENRYWHIVKTREAKEAKKAKEPGGKLPKERKFLIDEGKASDIVFSLQQGNDRDTRKGTGLLSKAFPGLEKREILEVVKRVEGETFKGTGNYRTYLQTLCMEVTRKDSESGNKTG